RYRRASDYEGIPERKAVQAVQVDGGEDVDDFDPHEREAREQLHLAPGDLRRHSQLTGCDDEILLKHLARNHTLGFPPAGLDDRQGGLPLPWLVTIVRVDEDVGIQKATSGHGSRRG